MIRVGAEPVSDAMERRLLAWGAWRSRDGTGCGYPTRNVLDPGWSPPAQGMVPSMRVHITGDGDERWLEGRIQALSVKLRDALYVVYVKRLQPAEQARTLQCQAGTVRARVLEAKRRLALLPCESAA